MDNNARKQINEIIISRIVEENIDFILKNIPEISHMIGFEHKHPHHHLDVWGHTLLALKSLESKDLETNMAVLLHDIGKPFSYQDEEIRHFHGHPQISAQMSGKILRRLGYDREFIDNVCYLVRTHDTIIQPDNLDNTYNMIQKRLMVQYADANAHKPDKVEKRVKLLDEIREELQIRKSIEKQKVSVIDENEK